MRKATAELILKDPDRFAHHDRVFLNNPVVMQGMGLAPLVVLATTAHNGVMLAAAVTLLLVRSSPTSCTRRDTPSARVKMAFWANTASTA